MNLLTANLAKEQPNIDWLLLKPAHVTTAMTGFKKDFFCVSAQQCVGGALKDLGHVVLSNGALWHKVQSFLSASVPRWRCRRLIARSRTCGRTTRPRPGRP